MNPIRLKSNPLFYGDDTLFDEVSLSEKQRVDSFMARWFEYMKPADHYLRYFATHDYEKTFSKARDLFLTYVVRGSWSEQRFIMSVDYVFVNRWELSHASMAKAEKMWGRLPLQRRSRRRGI